MRYSGGSNSGSGGGGSPAPLVPVVSSLAKIKGGLTETDSQNVTLEFSVTGAAMMALSNTANFAGAVWEQYSPTKNWLLTSGVGAKTIYAKFRSSLGRELAVYKVNIVLNDGYTPVVVS